MKSSTAINRSLLGALAMLWLVVSLVVGIDLSISVTASAEDKDEYIVSGMADQDIEKVTLILRSNGTCMILDDFTIDTADGGAAEASVSMIDNEVSVLLIRCCLLQVGAVS